MALGGVVLDAGECPPDFAEGFVVELSAAAALHEPARFAQAGGGLVEIDLAPVGVAVGHAEFQVLHPAFQSVEVVTGEGVGAGSGDAAEGSRGDTDGEAAGRDALGQA